MTLLKRFTLVIRDGTVVTELGDADLTEQGVMTLSGHKTPQAARLYVKRTERQRISAARKRRQWVEANHAAVAAGASHASRMASCPNACTLPFAILSDEHLELTRAMVFYPVFPPDRSASDVVE